MDKKIFVMGGGGFIMEPDNLLLDQYILSLSEKNCPKVCFIPTASGDSENYINAFHSAYRTFFCEYSVLSLFNPTGIDIRKHLLEQDIIFVGGGNTKNLLCLWREWKVDQYLKEAYENGVILAGMSAGMNCWFEEALTNSLGNELTSIQALGFLEGSSCPHFDGEPNRRPSYITLLREGKIKGGVGVDDSVGIYYLNGKIKECVSSMPGKNVSLFQTNPVIEKKIPVRFLGKN